MLKLLDCWISFFVVLTVDQCIVFLMQSLISIEQLDNGDCALNEHANAM